MFFNYFRRHAFNDYWKFFEVLQMAQPQIILWWSVIGRSWRGSKERIIVSLIIKSFVSACIYPSKPPSSGEEMSSLCNCFRNTPIRVSVLSILLQITHQWQVNYHALLETHTHLVFSLSTQLISVSLPVKLFCSNNDGLIDHFTSVLLNWEIKYPRFVEAFFSAICTWHATLK